MQDAITKLMLVRLMEKKTSDKCYFIFYSFSMINCKQKNLECKSISQYIYISVYNLIETGHFKIELGNMHWYQSLNLMLQFEYIFAKKCHKLIDLNFHNLTVYLLSFLQ